MAGGPRPVSSLALAILLVAAGCSTPAPDASSHGAPSLPAVDPEACPDIDLRGPTGDRVDLTGTWETVESSIRGGIYFMRQVGSCLWFAGGFPDSDEPPDEFGPLSFLTVVFRGSIRSDFSIHGTWVDVRQDLTALGAGGELDLRIVFDDAGAPRLVYVDHLGEPFIDPQLPADDLTWVKLNDGGRYPPP